MYLRQKRILCIYLDYTYGGIQLCLLLGGLGEGESIKIQICVDRKRGVTSMPTFAYTFLIVHKLLIISIRFFVSFIKIHNLLRISVLKNYILLVSKISNQLCLIRAITLK